VLSPPCGNAQANAAGVALRLCASMGLKGTSCKRGPGLPSASVGIQSPAALQVNAN
jgi:hypothetical protein